MSGKDTIVLPAGLWKDFTYLLFTDRRKLGDKIKLPVCSSGIIFGTERIQVSTEYGEAIVEGIYYVNDVAVRITGKGAEAVKNSLRKYMEQCETD